MRTLCTVSAILLLLALAPALTNCQGRTFYVSSASGNDMASGLSPQTPWQTVTKIRNTIFAAGDSILFQSGQTWTETMGVALVPSSSGASGNPVLFGSYGSGPKPIIRCVTGDHALRLYDLSWITFDGLDFRGSPVNNSCIDVEGANHIVFRNCNIGYGARGIGLDLNSLNSAKRTSDSGSVYNCTFNSGETRFFPNKDSIHVMASDGINLHAASYWEIYNNTFTGWTHGGIEIYSDTVKLPANRNYVHNNSFYGGGISYCRAFGIVGKKPNCAKGNFVAYNYIQDMTVPNQIGGDTNYIVGNFIKTMRDTLGQGTATGLSLESDFQAYGVCRGNLLWYNLIDGAQTYGIQVTDFSQCHDTLVAGNEITGNVVTNSGRYDFAIPSTQSCVVRNIVMDNSFSSFGGVSNIQYRGNIIGVFALNSMSAMGDLCRRNR